MEVMATAAEGSLVNVQLNALSEFGSQCGYACIGAF
jgi:hypothetical protein